MGRGEEGGAGEVMADHSRDRVGRQLDFGFGDVGRQARQQDVFKDVTAGRPTLGQSNAELTPIAPRRKLAGEGGERQGGLDDPVVVLIERGRRAETLDHFTGKFTGESPEQLHRGGQVCGGPQVRVEVIGWGEGRQQAVEEAVGRSRVHPDEEPASRPGEKAVAPSFARSNSVEPRVPSTVLKNS